MPRNLDRRVEALVPVARRRTCRSGSTRSSRSSLADDTLAWTLGADGRWRHVRGPNRFGSADTGRVETHRQLQELALERRKA